jgi:hypothetical protein
MRQIKDIQGARIVGKELGQWKDRISSKNQDLKGLKIQNAGDASEPGDYVTLRQLHELLPNISSPDQHFSIPFSSVGVVSIGQISAPFIVGSDRVGNPTAISVAVPSITQAPSGGPLTVNLTLNGADMLATPLILNSGAEGPVTSSQFITPLPKLAVGYKIVPKIITANGAAFVTIQLYVTRILT